MAFGFSSAPASWSGWLWMGPGAIHLVCHPLKVCVPDGCVQQVSHLNREGDGFLDGQADSSSYPYQPLTGRGLPPHWRQQPGSGYSICKSRGLDVFPCAASMAFQGDVVKEDFAGPFPCENLTSCTFPWPVRAGQNMQPQHHVGGAFHGSWSCSVCPIPGLEAKQRLLASPTH